MVPRSAHCLLLILALTILSVPFAPTMPSMASPAAKGAASSASSLNQDAPQRQLIIFVPGINSSQEIVSPVDQPFLSATFGELKQQLIDTNGYTPNDFVDYSYAPEGYEDGSIAPRPYTCEDSGRDLDASSDQLLALIRNVHHRFPTHQIALVGHSMGGMVIINALDRLPGSDEINQVISAVVTIASPLYGASSNDLDALSQALVWLGTCPFSGVMTESAAALQLATELRNHEAQVAAKNESPAEAQLKHFLVRFHANGARIGTFGNRFDCVYNHEFCGDLLTPVDTDLLGNQDLSWTQVYPQGLPPFDYSAMYEFSDYWPSCGGIEACIGASHDYLLRQPQSEMLMAIGPASGVAVSEATSLPTSFLGIWEGEGAQTNPPVTWPITIELTGGNVGDVVGTIDYPADPCHSELILSSVESPTSITLSESITDGPCIDGGTFTLNHNSDGSLHFTWDHPSDDTVAEGVLSSTSGVVPTLPGGDPSQTSYVHILALACPSTSEVSFTITILPFATDPGSECTAGTLNVSLTDAAGSVGYYNSHNGRFPLDLPAGSYTITELDSGTTATFYLPLVDTRETQPPECVGRAGCVSIVISIPASELPGLVDTSRLHEFFVGHWEGTGTQINPANDWPIFIAFVGGTPGEIVGTVEYPTLGCGGELVLTYIDPNDPFLTIEVTEDITYGEDLCIDGGTLIISGTEGCCGITFRWSSPDGGSTAEGRLDPASDSEGGGTTEISPSTSTGAITVVADSLFIDLGDPASEAGFGLQGWGGAQGDAENPLTAPSGDTSKRFQGFHADNSLVFSPVIPGTTYVLTTEVDDGGCADDFQIVASGQIVYSFFALDGPDEVRIHETTIPGDLVTSDSLVVAFRNTSRDDCGLAAVYNVRLDLPP